MTPADFDAPFHEPVAEQIKAFLQRRTFYDGAFIGTLTKPLLRALLPHFPKHGGLGVTPVCEWAPVTPEVYDAQDSTVQGWINSLGVIEGIGTVDLLVWEGSLDHSTLNYHIRKMRRCFLPEFKCNPEYKLPLVIILIGEAADAAGHRLYQWTRFPGLAMGC